MKTWVLLAGLVGLGSLALFGGSQWFSSDETPTEDVLEEVAALSNVRDANLKEPPAAPASKTRLALRLSLREPATLLKTVDQVLVQKIPGGDQTSRSSLELAVTLRLEEEAPDGSQLLSVVYNRVRYWQDVAGRSFAFDSTVPAEPLPVEALPYKGLVGNGFSFWISPDHRLIKPVGFPEFLERCIRDVPPDRQRQVVLAFASAAQEGLASFVDENLGFLPPTPTVEERDTWKCDRRLAGPIPLQLSTRCTLARMTEQFAEIEMEGTIDPVKSPAFSNHPAGDVQVQARGGRTTGHCEIDRKTGLPLHCEVKRQLDMQVQLADGRRFDQQKMTTATIRLVPPQTSRPARLVIPASGRVSSPGR